MIRKFRFKGGRWVKHEILIVKITDEQKIDSELEKHLHPLWYLLPLTLRCGRKPMDR